MSTESKPLNGEFCWNELMTSNPSKAEKFYKELFGWTSTSRDMGGKEYTTFMQGDKSIGGMFQTPKEQADIPPRWVSYINVEDIDKALEKVKSLSGSIIVQKTKAGDIGYFAMIQDPTGAQVALWQMLSGAC